MKKIGESNDIAKAGRSKGDDIVAGLRELIDVLRSGEPLESRFTVRDLQDRPAAELRCRGRAPRARVAGDESGRVRGVPRCGCLDGEVVGAGLASAEPLACRLLSEIEAEPAHWRKRLAGVRGRSRDTRPRPPRWGARPAGVSGTVDRETAHEGGTRFLTLTLQPTRPGRRRTRRRSRPVEPPGPMVPTIRVATRCVSRADGRPGRGRTRRADGGGTVGPGSPGPDPGPIGRRHRRRSADPVAVDRPAWAVEVAEAIVIGPVFG